nr:unnamed protein product [Spirometra erinaceieuropaei]
MSAQMYSVVEFINDESVTVVDKAWFYDKNCVMRLKNDRRRNILLQRNDPPPSGTKVYPVRIVKDNLTLGAARWLAHRAEDTSDLSFSEPTELGRGFRTKFVRRLTSDSEDDDDDKNIVGRQPEVMKQLVSVGRRNNMEHDITMSQPTRQNPPRERRSALEEALYYFNGEGISSPELNESQNDLEDSDDTLPTREPMRVEVARTIGK